MSPVKPENNKGEKESEIVKALVMLPLTALTVAWSAYAKGILARVQEVYEQRGRQDFDRFMAWQEKADRAIRWMLAGTEDK